MEAALADGLVLDDANRALIPPDDSSPWTYGECASAVADRLRPYGCDTARFGQFRATFLFADWVLKLPTLAAFAPTNDEEWCTYARLPGEVASTWFPATHRLASGWFVQERCALLADGSLAWRAAVAPLTRIARRYGFAADAPFNIGVRGHQPVWLDWTSEEVNENLLRIRRPITDLYRDSGGAILRFT